MRTNSIWGLNELPYSAEPYSVALGPPVRTCFFAVAAPSPPPPLLLPLFADAAGVPLLLVCCRLLWETVTCAMKTVGTTTQASITTTRTSVLGDHPANLFLTRPRYLIVVLVLVLAAALLESPPLLRSSSSSSFPRPPAAARRLRTNSSSSRRSSCCCCCCGAAVSSSTSGMPRSGTTNKNLRGPSPTSAAVNFR